MQMLGSTDAFDGGDLAELRHSLHLLGAGADHFTVKEYGAGSTDACAAADLDSREAHAPENERQRIFLGIAGDEPINSVDGEAQSGESHSFFPLFHGRN
jgi:hypothetical protein